MITLDGRRLISTKRKNHVKWELCARWEELKECVQYHAEMAAYLDAPTKFIFLNPPHHGLAQTYGVAEMGRDMVDEELKSLFYALDCCYPSGCTPLANRLREIYHSLKTMEATLKESGQKVAVILATDGLPTDTRGYADRRAREDFEQALQKLILEIPVWCVVRLCTDDKEVIDYYESLDVQLELNLEVLDDYRDEAKEVIKFNPWLTYALPLHRCREMGFSHRLVDLLDERRLTRDEVRGLLNILFGNFQSDLHGDWDVFISELRSKLRDEDKTYNPVHQRVTPWIDARQICWCYGPESRRIKGTIIFLVILLAILAQVYRK
jgi:hypothetical protein